MRAKVDPESNSNGHTRVVVLLQSVFPNPQKDNQAGLCHLCDQSQLPGKESLSCTVDGNRRWRISAHLQTIKLVQRSKPCWDGATEVVA
jgi:hypothetical protein